MYNDDPQKNNAMDDNGTAALAFFFERTCSSL